MRDPEDSRSRTERLALLAVYAAAGLCLLPGFADQINPDGVSRPNAPPKQVKEELARSGAPYFLACAAGPQPPFLSTWEEVARAPGAVGLHRVPSHE